MKSSFILFITLQFIAVVVVIGQVPVSQIEGYLEVFHPGDTTSIYMGKMAGQNSDPGHGRSNSFFGFESGMLNAASGLNSFFGAQSGRKNNMGINNSFFGFESGRNNTGGSANAFYGASSGLDNMSGTANTFVGWLAGDNNISGRFNTALGYSTKVNNGTLEYATVLGAQAEVSTDNTLVLGRPEDAAVIPGRLIVGQPEPTIPDNIGTAVHINAGEAGDSELIIESDTNNAGSENDNPTIRLRQDGNTVNAFIAMEGNGGTTSTGTIANSFLIGSEGNNVPLHFITSDISRMTIKTNGHVAINELGAAGSIQLCRNSLLELATCSSSIRYKKEVTDYNTGLDLIDQLRPVTYLWRESNVADLGFIAEEMAEIDERLIFRNDNHEVEGVKYDRLTTILVNAIKQQQEMMVRMDAQLQREKETNINQKKLLAQLNQKNKVLHEEMEDLLSLEKRLEKLEADGSQN